MLLDIKLLVDGKEISLNEFVSKILSGTFVGAIGSLREIDGNWKKIKVEITR
jgi:transcription antitermination factor NusG